MSDIILLSGNSNIPLAQGIADYMDVSLSPALVSTFSDGETRVEIQENIRGKDIFVIQSTSSPANHNIMEAMIIADACRRASADRITLVTPYFGYARQERKNSPRTPITAKLIADFIQTAGFNRVLTLELHAGAIQGFFNIPVDHLFAKPLFAKYLKDKNISNQLIVSPDAGGVERARALAKQLNCGIAIIDKRRDKPNESEVMHLIGDVEGKNCIIYDDMCDTGGSLCKAAKAIIENGASSVIGAIAHPILSNKAQELIQDSVLESLIITNSINTTNLSCEKIRVLDISSYLGKAIKRVHNNESVSSLFT